MTELFGAMRSVVQERYALLAPESFVPSQLPGWEKAACHVLISPGMGARFSQLLIRLERDGQCAGNTGVNEYFLYVLDGAASVLIEARKHRLEPGNYAYLPAGQDVQIASGAPATRLLVFQKPYRPVSGVPRPAGLSGHEREARSQPLRNNGDVRLQALLPEHPAFDMTVSLLTCPPGAALPVIEAPVMERGWLILRGQGLCRLGSDWHPVREGDVIWTAPYCPQWFLAMGKTPACCLYYQDINRDPV